MLLLLIMAVCIPDQIPVTYQQASVNDSMTSVEWANGVRWLR
jgi:hypothetical protein